jgi:hypothetical protein
MRKFYTLYCNLCTIKCKLYQLKTPLAARLCSAALLKVLWLDLGGSHGDFAYGPHLGSFGKEKGTTHM